LQTLDESFKIDGKYEFLLQYPELSGFNRWKQTINPILETKAGKTVVNGYQGIHIDWSGWYWGGLARSTFSFSCVDGSIATGNWYYTIGTYAGSAYTPKFPGPAYSNTDDIRVNEVYLWVKTNRDISEKTKERAHRITTLVLPILLSTVIIVI